MPVYVLHVYCACFAYVCALYVCVSLSECVREGIAISSSSVRRMVPAIVLHVCVQVLVCA